MSAFTERVHRSEARIIQSVSVFEMGARVEGWTTNESSSGVAACPRLPGMENLQRSLHGGGILVTSRAVILGK